MAATYVDGQVLPILALDTPEVNQDARAAPGAEPMRLPLLPEHIRRQFLLAREELDVGA